MQHQCYGWHCRFTNPDLQRDGDSDSIDDNRKTPAITVALKGGAQIVRPRYGRPVATGRINQSIKQSGPDRKFGDDDCGFAAKGANLTIEQIPALFVGGDRGIRSQDAYCGIISLWSIVWKRKIFAEKSAVRWTMTQNWKTLTSPMYGLIRKLLWWPSHPDLADRPAPWSTTAPCVAVRKSSKREGFSRLEKSRATIALNGLSWDAALHRPGPIAGANDDFKIVFKFASGRRITTVYSSATMGRDRPRWGVFHNHCYRRDCLHRTAKLTQWTAQWPIDVDESFEPTQGEVRAAGPPDHS